jgi:hypothetical protein
MMHASVAGRIRYGAGEMGTPQSRRAIRRDRRTQADPTQFALTIDGTGGQEINTEGDLVLNTANGEIQQHAPTLYQDVGGARHISGPSGSVEFGEFRTPTSSGEATLPILFKTYHPAFFIDTQGNAVFDFGGLTQYNLVDQTSSLVRRASLSTAAYPVTVGSTPALIVALPFDSGAPTITLTDPNGNTITSASTDPNVAYTTTPTEVVATVGTPQAGNWTATANPPATTSAPGTVVTLTATASAGHTFTGWTVDGTDGGKTNPLPLTATSSDATVANFAPLPAITGVSLLRARSTGAGA